jgi:hypothetical protein
MKSRTAQILCFSDQLEWLRFSFLGRKVEVKNAWSYNPIPTHVLKHKDDFTFGESEFVPGRGARNSFLHGIQTGYGNYAAHYPMVTVGS